MKQKISAFLCVILLMGFLPVTARADSATQDGAALLPQTVTAALDGSTATVSVKASDVSLGTYFLAAAAYDETGKMLSANLETVQFSQSTQTFSIPLTNCTQASRYKAFFLTSDYRPATTSGAAVENPIVPLEQTHTALPLTAVDGIEPYSTHWFGDTEITADLTGASGLAYSLTISDQTTFSAPPAGYDPDALIEWGKDPGLGVEILHEHGFTGEGAVIAYVDQPIAVPYHEQYSGVNLHYINTVTDTGGDNSMHGPAVLSLLGGKDIGTAPGAEVYYYAHASWLADQSTHANCLLQIIEQNKSLPEGQKITMVAFSDNIDPSEANAEAFREAVEACEAAGIMVWFCGEYYSASFLPMSDRNDPENLTWDNWVTPGSTPSLVYVPAGSRTTAATMGGASYIYWASGGLSWTMPYMLGLYAIASEIDPELTQDQMRSLVTATAYENSAGMKIVNPVGFIAAVLDRVGRTEEAASLRADAAAQTKYLYAVMDTAAMSEADLTAVAGYLSTVTDAAVLVADAAGFADAASLYEALQADAASRGGTVAGVQIFGTPSMVPAFSISYRVQMAGGVDEGGTLLTDLFYGNFENDAEDLTSEYNVLDHFEQGWDIDLVPQWPVARLPLEKGEYPAFFEKYETFAEETGLTRQTLVNFSNPIFASEQHIDDMGAFLNRMHNEFQILDSNYRLYGNLRGDYPVTTSVQGGFTADNLTYENANGIVEFLINSHGQRDNIDCCYFVHGEEIRESLINSATISSVLGGNPYYLDCWTCNNGYGMENNLTTAALKGACVGVFSATSVISNNGVNWSASLDEMRNSNFYYFYYSYLKALHEGKTRAQAFSDAQSAYASALIEDSANGIRGEGNYQFNLYNLLAYENFGALEPSAAAISLYKNAGYITQAGQSVPKEPADGDSGGDSGSQRNPTTSGTPIGDAWEVPYFLQDDLHADTYTIYGLTAQRLTNGYVRITVDYKGAEGMYIDAFNPPSGSVFMLLGGTVSGERETFSFDLSWDDLSATDSVTVLFYGKVADRFWLNFKTAEVLEGLKDRSILFALNADGTPYVYYIDVNGVPENAVQSRMYITAEDGTETWIGGYSAAQTWAEMHGWTLEAGVYSGAYVKYLDNQFEEISGGYTSDAGIIVQQSETQITYTGVTRESSGDNDVLTFSGLTPYTCRYTVALYDSAGQPVSRWNDYAGASGTISVTVPKSAFPDGLIQCVISGNGGFSVSQDGKVLTCQVYQPTDMFMVSSSKNVEFTTQDELQSGSVTVHSCTSQLLENGDTRITLEFTAPVGMRTCIFEPPNGEHYKMFGLNTTGGRDTLIFDLTEEQLSVMQTVAINVFTGDDNRFFILIQTEDL